MRNFKRFISILLVTLLLATVVFSLVACHKNKGNQSQTDLRNDYCNELETIVVPSLNSSWSANMSEDKIALLDNAGEYVVTTSWVSLLKDVVYSSSLQTEKIKAVVDYLKTDDGKAMIEDFSKNGANILDLFDDMGLTNEDISNLIYDILYEVIDRSDSILSDMNDKLIAVKSQTNATESAKKNIKIYIDSISQAAIGFVPTELEKADFLTGLNNAKSGIADLVKFAYNISIGALTDNILAILESEDGALTDLDNNEIVAVINAIANNVVELKDSLTQDKINYLNATIELIVAKFDKVANTSLVFSQIVSYANTAYLIVDAIPEICDVLNAVISSIDESTIDLIKEYIVYLDAYNNKESSDNVLIANSCIVTAKIISSVLSNIGETKFKSLVNSLYQKATASDDYQKAFPLYCADIVANLSEVLKGLISEEETIETSHPTIVSVDVLADIINLTFGLNRKLTKFKEAYITDKLNDDESFTESNNVADNYLSEYVENNYSSNKPTEWYKTYVEGIVEYLNATSKEVLSLAKQDLDLFITEYFAKDSTIKANMEDLANDALLAKDANNSVAEEINTKSQSANILYTVSLVIVLIDMQSTN